MLAYENKQFCKCLERPPLRAALRQLWDEIVELIHTPSLDELSDCTFTLGRLLGSLSGQRYIKMPFDKKHWIKIEARMKFHGCVRSPQHLRSGQCPSA